MSKRNFRPLRPGRLHRPDPHRIMPMGLTQYVCVVCGVRTQLKKIEVCRDHALSLGWRSVNSEGHLACKRCADLHDREKSNVSEETPNAG